MTYARPIRLFSFAVLIFIGVVVIRGQEKAAAPPPVPIVIHAGSLVDVAAGVVRPNQVVMKGGAVIVGGR